MKLLQTNMFIFKENLKLITEFCVDQLCAQQLDGRLVESLMDRLDDESIGEIKEEDEEVHMSDPPSRNTNNPQVSLKGARRVPH